MRTGTVAAPPVGGCAEGPCRRVPGTGAAPHPPPRTRHPAPRLPVPPGPGSTACTPRACAPMACTPLRPGPGPGAQARSRRAAGSRDSPAGRASLPPSLPARHAQVAPGRARAAACRDHGPSGRRPHLARTRHTGHPRHPERLRGARAPGARKHRPVLLFCACSDSPLRTGRPPRIVAITGAAVVAPRPPDTGPRWRETAMWSRPFPVAPGIRPVFEASLTRVASRARTAGLPFPCGELS